jgi:pimeloyl-ACP methyl ester carboxylesterase
MAPLVVRRYGRAPFGVAVVHGGPGAGGEMAPVARELGSGWGVLEPIQTATSLSAQVAELRTALEGHGAIPITLIGFSWGAWLSWMVAAHHPAIVKKLILVGSGPFDEVYVARLRQARMSRLSPDERKEYEFLVNSLLDVATEDKGDLLGRLGALSSKTEDYDPLDHEPVEGDQVALRGDIFQKVWEEGAEMRRSARLLALASRIQCPVVAIHGEYDPHPAEGVQVPLSGTLEAFRFVLLKQCGHTPWIERQARTEFYSVLKNEIC